MTVETIPLRPPRLARAALAMALALAATGAGATIVEGTTNDGHRYVAGGIGTDEVDTLRGESASYSLQLITAARGGAYLAGTHVRILDGRNQPVLDATIDGPWLLVDLPQGSYTMQVSYGGSTVERRLSVAPGKPQRIVLHFDAPVDQDIGVAPDAAGSRVPQPR